MPFTFIVPYKLTECINGFKGYQQRNREFEINQSKKSEDEKLSRDPCSKVYIDQLVNNFSKTNTTPKSFLIKKKYIFNQKFRISHIQ